MSRLFITLSLLIAIPLGASEPLRVGTFNCEFLNVSRIQIKYGYRFELEDANEIQKWDASFRQQKFLEATEAVARSLSDLKVDIWCFTEIGNQTESIALQKAFKKFGHDFPFLKVCNSKDTFTGQYVAIMSRFPLEMVSDSIEGRAFYDAEMDDPYTEHEAFVQKGLHVTADANGQLIHLFGVHLTSEMGGHDKDERRIAQATIVRRAYLPLLQSGEHVIVLGDLNDDIGQPAIKRIRGRHDIFEALIQTADRRYIDSDDWSSRWTYNFRGEYNVIDHILVSNSLVGHCPKNEDCIRTRVIPLWDTEHFKVRDHFTVSDHRPLIVEIQQSQPTDR